MPIYRAVRNARLDAYYNIKACRLHIVFVFALHAYHVFRTAL